MHDSIDVPVPGRRWALCAIQDLRAEGLEAELLPCGGDDGPWTVRVTGPAGTIAEIRAGLEVPTQFQVPTQRMCWETFVNATITG